MTDLVFEGNRVETYIIDNEIWVSGTDVGRLLGYGSPRQRIHQLYNANADEFSVGMSRIARLSDLRPQIADIGQDRNIRIFNMRGAHLLGIFAKTPKAKDFRKFILDLLDDLAKGRRVIEERHQQVKLIHDEQKAKASEAGKALGRWRHLKQPLENQLEYWDAKLQLILDLGIE